MVLGGENARDSVAVGDMCRLGGNGASENVGSDSGIGSAAEGIEAVFSGVGYGRLPLGCSTPLLESGGGGGQVWKGERTRFLAWIYIASREVGPGKVQNRIQRMFPRGKGWGGEHQSPDGVLDPVTGGC